MVQDESLKQSDVDAVWESVWNADRATTLRATFSNRLFLEGYRIMRPLVSDDSRAILETGTGSGRYAVALARDLPAAQVTATDIVPSSLVATQRLAREAGVSNIKVEHADVEHLQYQNDAFDVVFSDALIQHVPDDALAVREMVRVLRPGGVLIIAVVNRQSVHFLVRILQSLFGHRNEYGSERFYSRGRLRRLVKDAGLEIVTETGFYPAYGIYRLGRKVRLSALLGRVLNRLTRILDSVTQNRVSRWFGFEIVILGRKPCVGSPGPIR